jgi:hypothetical protein
MLAETSRRRTYPLVSYEMMCSARNYKESGAKGCGKVFKLSWKGMQTCEHLFEKDVEAMSRECGNGLVGLVTIKLKAIHVVKAAMFASHYLLVAKSQPVKMMVMTEA